jgi:hypothetical protein
MNRVGFNNRKQVYMAMVFTVGLSPRLNRPVKTLVCGRAGISQFCGEHFE